MAAALIALLTALLVLPWVLANTPLRNRLFSSFVADPAIQVTSDGASFGYFSPLAINGLHVRFPDGGADVRIQQIDTEKSWPALLWERSNLGPITFVHPDVDVILDRLPESNTDRRNIAPRPPPDSDSELPELTALIRDATIRVRSQRDDIPAVDLAHFNVTFRLQPSNNGSLFVIDPVTIFERQKLTPEICHSGLQLVAPLLASQIDIEGDFTLQLQRFQLPLMATDFARSSPAFDVAGVVQLHSAAISIKDSIARSIVRLIDQFLVFPIPDQMHVIEDSTIEFHVADGRVYHQGFAMVLPHGGKSIEVQTLGSVGLDRSLDMQIRVKLPGQGVRDSELARLIGTDPFVLVASGTLDKPILKPQLPKAWPDSLQQLWQSDVVLERAAEILGRTRESMADLLDRRQNNDQRLMPKMRERLQKRRQRRRDRVESGRQENRDDRDQPW